MKIPLSWLKEFVDINIPAEELAHRLTMAGLEVGEVITIGGWENCYVGYVEKVERLRASVAAPAAAKPAEQNRLAKELLEQGRDERRVGSKRN